MAYGLLAPRDGIVGRLIDTVGFSHFAPHNNVERSSDRFGGTEIPDTPRLTERIVITGKEEYEKRSRWNHEIEKTAITQVARRTPTNGVGVD